MTREEDYMAPTEHAVNHAKPLSTDAEPSAPVRSGYAPSGGLCTMGVGCEEAGLCAAEQAGEPDRCPRAEREAMADLIACGVRKINRVIASGMHERDAIYELTDSILALGNTPTPKQPIGETLAAAIMGAAS